MRKIRIAGVIDGLSTSALLLRVIRLELFKEADHAARVRFVSIDERPHVVFWLVFLPLPRLPCAFELERVMALRGYGDEVAFCGQSLALDNNPSVEPLTSAGLSDLIVCAARSGPLGAGWGHNWRSDARGEPERHSACEGFLGIPSLHFSSSASSAASKPIPSSACASRAWLDHVTGLKLPNASPLPIMTWRMKRDTAFSIEYDSGVKRETLACRAKRVGGAQLQPRQCWTEAEDQPRRCSCAVSFAVSHRAISDPRAKSCTAKRPAASERSDEAEVSCTAR